VAAGQLAASCTASYDPVVPIDFEKEKQLRQSDPGKVRCAHCGAWILARATRCPKCGVNFQGEAFQFVHEGSDELLTDAPRRRRRALVLGFLLILALIAGSVLYFAR
jgi:predicted nucleic acid-binding Zn ribbon protein